MDGQGPDLRQQLGLLGNASFVNLLVEACGSSTEKADAILEARTSTIQTLA